MPKTKDGIEYEIGMALFQVEESRYGVAFVPYYPLAETHEVKRDYKCTLVVRKGDIYGMAIESSYARIENALQLFNDRMDTEIERLKLYKQSVNEDFKQPAQ